MKQLFAQGWAGWGVWRQRGRGSEESHRSVGQSEPSPLLLVWLLILPLPRFTVTTEIDSLAGIDYSLMEAPRAAAQMLDVMLKVRVLEHGLG